MVNSRKRSGHAASRGLALMPIFVLILFGVRVQAEVVPDLYTVSVPVAEQSQGELQRAAGAGLRELAVRISGRSSAASAPGLAASFANAMRYLDQYRFERNTGGEAPWLAQLRFAPVQIDAELRRAGLPIWGGNRPALQTVVVIEDRGVRNVIDESSPVANALREQWRRRGLVLHLPPRANSTNSARAINVDDVAQLDVAKVAAGGQERSDGYVLGRVALTAGGACESGWAFNLGTPTGVNAPAFNTDASGSTLSMCVASALDRIVDNFSAQYAVAANSGAEGIVLRVTGIASFDDYSALLNYLRRLALVKSVQPVLVHGDEILLQLKVAGDAEQVARQLALENRLTPTASAASGPVPATLNYRWSVVRN